jgi:hypothetical protein
MCQVDASLCPGSLTCMIMTEVAVAIVDPGLSGMTGMFSVGLTTSNRHILHVQNYK